ncbi:MAG: Na+/H+ antiporter NhaA [Bdellovibrionales bacterium]|nr:Na+/H+ antiporter NhaA [Bdellovibrionales bacterium]
MSDVVHAKRTPIAILQEFSIPLIAGVITAVLWANLDSHGYHELNHWSPFGHDSHFNFHFLMNDLFMALFFGIAAKEITESCLPGGALNPPRKAVNPLLGTLGGVLGPVTVYFAIVFLSGDHTIANGWGIPTATDIALAWLVARVIFGKGHPAVSFLLLLAVADDGLGLGIIAIFYPDPHHPVQPAWLLLTGAGAAACYGMRRAGIQNFWYYVVVGGAMSWSGLYFAHLHPALALVPIIPFMPSSGHDEGLFAEGEDEKNHDTLNEFEHFFKLPVDLGLFGFGLANAGVEFSSMGSATIAVLLALAIGKTAGIFLFSYVGDRLGFPLPAGMGWRSLVTAGCVAGLGLTVALFVAGVAFTDNTLQGAAKMGALLSALVAPAAIMLGKMLGVREEYARLTAQVTRIVEADEIPTDRPVEAPAEEIRVEEDTTQPQA